MAKGNCYQANFDEMVNNPDTYNSDEWRLVHAVRENVKGSEWWGGHCFLLNTEENLVFDFSNGAMIEKIMVRNLLLMLMKSMKNGVSARMVTKLTLNILLRVLLNGLMKVGTMVLGS